MLYSSDEFAKSHPDIDCLAGERFSRVSNTENTLQFLQSFYPEHLWLEISEQDLEQAQLVAQNYANEIGRNYALLNYLCLSLLLKRLKQALELEIYPKISLNIWQFINGSSITINSKQLVIIPSEATDIEGFEVEQEWVDVPSLTADYYLPVQVNLEEKYLHFWGFISRKTLKEKAEYDPIYRMYFVEADWTIDSLDLLWITDYFLATETDRCFSLPSIEEQAVENLIQSLSQPSPYSPRLNIPFEQWGALLNEDEWRQQLYVECLIKSAERHPFIRLNQILNKESVLEATTQTLTERSPSHCTNKFRGHKLDTAKEIDRAIQTLVEEARQQELLPNVKEEDLLFYLLLKTPKYISGEAADIAWAIAATASPTDSKRVEVIEKQIADRSIALKIAIVPISSQKTILILRIYSSGEQSSVPPGLRLRVLTKIGTPVSKLDVTARSEPLDNYIQLYFAADRGESFGCHVILNNESFTEYFVV